MFAFGQDLSALCKPDPTPRTALPLRSPGKFCLDEPAFPPHPNCHEILPRKERREHSAGTTVACGQHKAYLAAFPTLWVPRGLSPAEGGLQLRRSRAGTREGRRGKKGLKSVQVFQCGETRVEGLPRTGQVQNRKPQGSDKWTLLCGLCIDP